MKGFLIIMLSLFVGHILSILLNVPIPGTVFGMIILLILLLTKVVKIEDVSNISDILITNMVIMFIPGGVGLINILNQFKGNIIKLLITIIVSTILIIIVTSFTADKLIALKEKRK